MSKAWIFVFLPHLLFAQQTSSDVQNQLDAYYESYMPLKVHVLINQPEYAPGDTVYFKTDLVTAQGHKPIAGKSILKISLTNSSNQHLLQQQFSIFNGQGANQLILPKNISNGSYILSVWSDWMMESNSIPWQKTIRIGSYAPVEQQRLHARAEGGLLIDGLSTRVAVVAPPLANIDVIENGVVISQLRVSKNGTATFLLVPKYHASYAVRSGDSLVVLSNVQPDGVALAATLSPSKNSVRVAVAIPEKSQYTGKTISLIASMQGIVFQVAEITLKHSFTTLEIPLGDFPEGILQLSLFDSDRNLISERLLYNKKPSTVTANATMQRKQFHTREKIDLNIHVLDEGKPAQSKLAVTAFHSGFTPYDSTSGTLLSDLFVSSDVGYSIPGPFDSYDAIDHHLILTTWSRFDWANLNKRSDGAFYSQYLIFKGQAVDSTTGLPLPDSTKLTFFLRKNADTYQAYTDTSGSFTIMLFDFFGTDEVFYRAEIDGVTVPGARISITGNQIQTDPSFVGNLSSGKYADLFEKRNAVNSSYASVTGTKNSFLNPKPDALEDEIFGADITISLSDYQLFPTMIETLREIVPFSQHRIVRGKNIVRIYDHDAELFRKDGPVYVIDGVVTDDTEYFLSLRPVDVVHIKIIHTTEKLNAFGSIGKGGMFIVETKIPDNAVNVPRSPQTFLLQGLNAPITRTNISHNSATLRTPDLRTNLLWLPNISTDRNGNVTISFYGSDAPGHYKIIGEGFTKDGKPFVFEKDFELVFENVSLEKN